MEFCAAPASRVDIAQLPTGEHTMLRKTGNSVIYFSDIQWMHERLCLRKIGALIGAHLAMKLSEKLGPRGHREDELWRWHQSPERNNKRHLVQVKTEEVCSPTASLFWEWSCELKMWRHCALIFVSLVTDSLCFEDWRRLGGGGAEWLFGVEYWSHERLK